MITYGLHMDLKKETEARLNIAEYENNRLLWMPNDNIPRGYLNTDGLTRDVNSHYTHERLIPHPNQVDPAQPPATTRRRIAGKRKWRMISLNFHCLHISWCLCCWNEWYFPYVHE